MCTGLPVPDDLNSKIDFSRHDDRFDLLGFPTIPTRPILSLSSLGRIKFLAAEPLPETLGVFCFGEAIHVEPFLIEHRMASAAQAEVFAEFMNLLVAAAFAKTRR